jgi:hypothetical protein
MSVAHEGGHMVVGMVTGVSVRQWVINSSDDALTSFRRVPWWPGRVLVLFAG